jgi:hypothetical protein
MFRSRSVALLGRRSRVVLVTATLAAALGAGMLTAHNAVATASTGINIDGQGGKAGRGTVSARLTVRQYDILVAFVAADGLTNAYQTARVSGAGLQWTLVRRANQRLGDAEIWTALANRAVTAATIASTLAVSGMYQQLSVIAFGNARGVGASGGGSSSGVAPSVSVQATAMGSLTYAVGNDWDNAIHRTLGAGQTLTAEYLAPVNDTYWVQRRTAATMFAGAVTLADVAPTRDQWNMAAVEIVPLHRPPMPRPPHLRVYPTVDVTASASSSTPPSVAPASSSAPPQSSSVSSASAASTSSSSVPSASAPSSSAAPSSSSTRAAPSTRYPDATTTGVPPGVTLANIAGKSGIGWSADSSGNVTVTGGSVTLDGYLIAGRVAADNVTGFTLANSKVECIGEDSWCVTLGDSATIRDTEIGGRGCSAAQLAARNVNCYGYAAGVWTGTTSATQNLLLRDNIHSLTRAVQNDGGTTIQDSFFHDSVYDCAIRAGAQVCGLHSSASFMSKGHGSKYLHNTLEDGSTAVIFGQVYDNDGSTLGDVTIDDNRIIATREPNGYTSSFGVSIENKHIDIPASIRITNNMFDAGPWDVGPWRDDGIGYTITGNKIVPAGSPINP